jgi:hypothetical protein
MRRAPVPVRTNALLEDLLRLIDMLPVQINLVLVHFPRGVVGAEDELGGLAVIVVHARGVLLALVGEGFGGAAVAGAVGFLGAVEAGVALLGLGAGEVAQAVVFALRLVVVVVGALEGCGRGRFKLADATAGDKGRCWRLD